jgi:hypothetical protein
MTAQRQEGNGWRPGIAFIASPEGFGSASLGSAGLVAGLVLAGLVLADLAFGVQASVPFAHAATTERVIVNRYSGLAIEGFDPVAYFVDAHPMIGLPEFEASEAGVVWRFRNEGNRASFVAHPDVYGPQFGGYDPCDLARGITFAGNPRFWLITEQRLYLFGREESRDAFAADPQRFLREANPRWPVLEQGLAR